jgi:ribosomal protein S12 methylthiotransferase accessory factor
MPVPVSEDSGGRHICRAASVTGTGTIDIPAQDVILDHAAVTGEPFTAEADTSGCAAGMDFEDALKRALLELIERDALSAWWYGRHIRRQLPLTTALAEFPRLLAHCETRSRHTQLLDISTDVPVRCVASVSWDTEGRDVAIGSAAHPNLEIAALSALTEMFQTEASFRVSGLENAELENWNQTVSIDGFSQLRGSERLADGLYHHRNLGPMEALREAGFQVYSMDFTLPGAPLNVVRAIVPGLTGLGRHKRPERIHQLRKSLRWTFVEKGGRDLEVIDPY